MNEGYKTLTVYKLAYKLAMEVFYISKSFPKEEKYVKLHEEYEEVGRMLGGMVKHPEKFLPK